MVSLIYAELLLNIRQITVFATLPTTSSAQTLVHLSSDQKSVSIVHNGERSTLQLPCQANSNATLKLPRFHSTELSFRLQATEKGLKAEAESSLNNYACIWPASALSPSAHIACKSCKNIFVAGGITAWKDLPSDTWAEMMDFWHCHKPHEPKNIAKTDGSGKGYAASNWLVVKPGTGFVDEICLRVADSDCKGIEVS